MTNSMRYNTAQERAEAFDRFCKSNSTDEGLCMPDCKLFHARDESKDYCGHCEFHWLDLEAEEEKPLPCPFCGCDDIRFSIVEDASDQYMACPHVFCKRCGATFELDWSRASDLGTNVTDEQKRQLLTRWNNRVAKKCMEAKE